MCTRLAAASAKVDQLLAHDRWFSSGGFFHHKNWSPWYSWNIVENVDTISKSNRYIVETNSKRQKWYKGYYFHVIKLIKQGYVAPRLKSSLNIIYGHHHTLVNRNERSIYQMAMHFLFLTYMFSFLYYCQDLYRNGLYAWVTRWVSYQKQELITLHEHLSSPPTLCWDLCCQTF